MQNIHVEAFNDYRVALCFEEGDCRFHVWASPDLTDIEDVLYKNPPRGLRPGDDGYFETRRLDGTNKANAPKVAALVAAIREGDMVTTAKRKMLADRAEADARAKAERAEAIRVGLAAAIGGGMGISYIAGQIAALTDDQLITLQNAMNRGPQ